MEKVRAGDQVVIRASTWNAFIDAANYVQSTKENQHASGIKSGLKVGVILVKNTENTDYEKFAAISLIGISITPDINENEFLSTAPVFEGAVVTSERKDMPFAILLEPLAKGAIGRAMILGLTPAKVTILKSTDQFASPLVDDTTGALQSSETGVARILWKGSSTGEAWCLLQLGGAGGGGSGGGESVMMCRVQGGDQTAGYQVSVYPNGRSDEGGTYSALLFTPDLALDSQIPTGTWIIGHSCQLTTTGGNDK